MSSVKRLIYLSPADDQPTGGIKVIYRHAEIMSDLGVDAFVLHPFNVDFRCTWFTHRARFLASLQLDPTGDFIVIPEIWAGIFGSQCIQQRVRYAIFVQNGYITHRTIETADAVSLSEVYTRATLIFSISENSSKMVCVNHPALDPQKVVRARYSVSDVFVVAPNADIKKIITYMPRKMSQHSDRVVFALTQHLPKDWRVISIDGVGEARCAEMMSQSSIFLSFSEFEGLPLPPLEAALSGNLVVGYTGQGAKEYFVSPNFTEIQQGDIIRFVQVTKKAAKKIEAGNVSPDIR